MNHQASNSPGDDSKKAALALFALALVIGIAAFFLGSRSKDEETAESERIRIANEQRLRVEASVNRHIQLTNRNIETDKEKIKIEAGFTIPRVGQLLSRPQNSDSYLDQRPDHNEMNPVRDLERRIESPPNPSARDIVQAEMAEQQAYNAATEKAMREYARQYVENAKQNGYDVKLDSDYRVIEVRPINNLPGAGPEQSHGGAFR